MKVVWASSEPLAPVVDAASTSSQGMAVGSTVTPSTRLPTTLLASFACHVGPPKWVPITRPLRSRSVARGAVSTQVSPVAVLVHV